jgi:ABC-type antimicrobial peptide transport system permease subunit
MRTTHELEATLPVTVTPLAELARREYDYRWAKVASLIFGTLAATATLLAVLGVYSLLAYGVVRRRREIGIRVSLGGDTPGILRAVLGPGLVMAMIGAGVGLALAAATGSVVRRVLVGVSPTDGWVLVGVAATIIATAALASLLPALRAVRIDPVIAFRGD